MESLKQKYIDRFYSTDEKAKEKNEDKITELQEKEVIDIKEI